MDKIKNIITILKESGYKKQIIKDIIILFILLCAVTAIFINTKRPLPIRFFFSSVLLNTEKEILKEYGEIYYPLYYFCELAVPIIKNENFFADNIERFYSKFIKTHKFINNIAIRNGDKYTSSSINSERSFNTSVIKLNENQKNVFTQKESLKERDKLIWDSYNIVSNEVFLNLIYVSENDISIYFTIKFNNVNSKNYYSKNSFAYIVNNNGIMLIPTNDAYDDVSKYEPIVSELHKKFRHDDQAVRIIYDNEAYWGYRSTFVTINTTNEIGIFAPEKSIAKKAISPFIAISVALMLIILLIIVFFTIRYIRLIEHIRREKFDIKNIIENGENDHTEFKSSLRYDYTEEKFNRCLEDVIMKSIAAFSNASGGRLIIGLDDHGNILGLENDYSTLKYPDKDHFELHLNTLLQNYYSSEFASSNIKIDFLRVENKDVCIVTITKGKEPLYTTITNKQGAKEEKFYIRVGNSSRELSKASEIYKYSIKRFR